MFYAVRLDYWAGFKAYKTAADMLRAVFDNAYSVETTGAGSFYIIDSYDNTAIFESNNVDSLNRCIVKMCANREPETGFYSSKLAALHDLAAAITSIDDEESIRELGRMIAAIAEYEEAQ